tara:strand:- start:401 stop:508 length:108 start_codon:yes stop_codon:yes gene_type:complete
MLYEYGGFFLAVDLQLVANTRSGKTLKRRKNGKLN